LQPSQQSIILKLHNDRRQADTLYDGDSLMPASEEIRKRLVHIIGSLINRSIEEAGKVPYLLDQEEAVDILVRNPALFEKLVQEEHNDRTEYARAKLTAKLDATTTLGQFEALDAFDMSFHTQTESDGGLPSLLEEVNQLSRAFVVYVDNAVTIFEGHFEHFMEKFRHTLRQAGLEMKAIDLAPTDIAEMGKSAESYLAEGRFLQAFLTDRLLTSKVINGKALQLSSPEYSLNENLIQSVVGRSGSFSPLIKFILRACYISQGSWEDLFAVLVKLVGREPGARNRSLLINLIEQDAIFCCNLLHDSFPNLKSWTLQERKLAIGRSIDDYGRDPMLARPVSRDP
jgi:hypothetical protein